MNRKILKEGIKYWGQIFLLPVYWFSFLFPRTKTLWLFGSTFGRRFTDNPRYFYLYMNAYKKNDVRAVWISHNKEVVEFLLSKGYEAYYYGSWKGIWHCLRAKIYIFDNYSKDISFWLSGGAKKINLWHGVALKKINHDNIHDKVRHPKNHWERFRYMIRRMSDEKPSHYVLATSKTMAEIYASAFQVPLDHVIMEGYPRNDALFGVHECFDFVTEKERHIINRISQFQKEQYKIIIYMPTFRESETMFFQVMNLVVFQKFLKENSFVFLTKLHPKSKLNQEFSAIDSDTMIHVDSEVDVYSILRYADILVTDYSSVYADYLLLNRPSVLFPYDYEIFKKDTREEYFDYNTYMKDEKAYTMQELMDRLLYVSETDIHEKDRMEALSWMFCNRSGNACEGLFSKIEEVVC